MKNQYAQSSVFFSLGTSNLRIHALILVLSTFFSVNLMAQVDNLEVYDAESKVAMAPVADDNPPVALCKNATVYLNSSGTVSILPQIVDNGSYDLEGPVEIFVGPYDFTCGPFPNTYQVGLIVRDNINQFASCTATLTVADNQVPVFTNCPTGPLVFDDAPGQCTVTATWPIPTATDNCSNTVVQIAGPISGTLLPNLTALVAYKATDPSGNSVNCSFNITVRDAQLPVFTSCPSNITQPANPISCSAVVNYPIPTATDNCPNVTVVRTTGPASGSTFPIGTTLVAFKATDNAGNPNTCSFTVTVNDVTPPNIICPASVLTNNSPATACSAVVTYGSISATDNCVAPTLSLIGGLVSGSTFPVGVTTITYRATDGSNNSSTCSFTVTVRDATPPNITCPANIVKNNDAGVCGATTTYSTPIATDNCSLTAGSLFLASGLTSGSFFPVGTTTNVWRVVDSGNNAATCSFTVTVKDVEPPTITCPADKLKGNDYGFCSAAIPFLGSPLFQDNCFVSTVTNNSPGTFPVGNTDVTWVVTDNHANSASCIQNVTIEDREYPVVTCPANIQVKTDEGDCLATIGYTAKATDNCPGLALSYSTDPFSAFPIGLTNVEAIATDEAGNSVNCLFQISVSTRTEICNDFDDDCDGLVDESEDWARIVKAFASDASSLSEYGTSVDIDGDYAIVGASKKSAGGQSIGAAYILFRDQNGANEWGQLLKLNAPGLLPGDNFGYSVAISNGIAAVGAPLDDNVVGNEGSVYIFAQNPANLSQWNFVKKINAADQDSGDNFGSSVALDESQLLVGAASDDETDTNAGAAYAFYRNQGGADNWGQVSKLMALTGAANDNMGVSVAIDGEYAVVGANGVDGLWQDAGAAYVFGRNQFGLDNWGQVAKMKAVLSGQNDNFGISVAISGPVAIVGADGNDLKGADAGIAFAFYKNQNGIVDSWGQRNIIVDNFGQAGDHFGCSVSLDGEYAVVGARGDDDYFGDDSGTGFVYLQQDNGWVLVGNLEDGGGKDGDNLGSCAAISGRTAILGAPHDDSPTNDEGSALVFGGLCNSDDRAENPSTTVTVSSATITCYPIPFSDELNITINGILATYCDVVLLNTLGQTVANIYNGALEGKMTFQVRSGEMEPGIYFLRVVADREIQTKTLVLER